MIETLKHQLEHCDGKDCTRGAWAENECGCDADWTPAEVYKLRHEVKLRDNIIATLERNNAELNEEVTAARRSLWLVLNSLPDQTATFTTRAIEDYDPSKCAIATGGSGDLTMWIKAGYRLTK